MACFVVGHIIRVRQLQEVLIDKVYARGVGAKMFENSKISRRELESIQTAGNDTKSAEILLNIVLERSYDKDFNECFLKSLEDSDQQYLADCIRHTGMWFVALIILKLLVKNLTLPRPWGFICSLDTAHVYKL